MDTQTILLLSLIPLTIVALSFASMVEKKQKKAKSIHDQYLDKVRNTTKVISLSQVKK